MHINGTVDVTAGSNHPAGYQMVTMHGYDVDKQGLSTCATANCHGTTLQGGNTGGPSCATTTGCHDQVKAGFTWQTQCTFCHGDITNGAGNGAPPNGVLGATATTDPTVGAHQDHVNATAKHAAWDCTMCHTKPSSALTPGHIDGTGGVVQAEITFSSLNPASAYSFTAFTCTNNYCHGSGTTTKTSPAWTSSAALACVDGCHGGAPSYTGMSSRHTKSEHKKACNYCHGSVVDATPAISNTALHVDGVKQVYFPGGGTYNTSTKKCSSVPGCHNGASDSW
jgi:predicted CxxxxCH...CXXCH cytochrome family protein